MLANQTITLLGVELYVTSDFEADWVDSGIGAYEYHGARGTHHAWGWEIAAINGMALDDDIRLAVRSTVARSNYNSRKRYLRAVRLLTRQVERAYAQLDPEDCADEEVLLAACGDAPDNARD